jgi:hypothetical protein
VGDLAGNMTREVSLSSLYRSRADQEPFVLSTGLSYRSKILLSIVYYIVTIDSPLQIFAYLEYDNKYDRTLSQAADVVTGA